MGKYYHVMYVCKVFDLLGKLNKIRSIRSESFVYEHVLIGMCKLLKKWLEN